MKTSCSSWSYHRAFEAKKIDHLGWIRECARLELDGVELLGFHFPATDPGYLRTVKKSCTDHYLTIAMVSANGHLTVGDDVQREKELEDIRRWVEIAAYLGAPCVRFFCGSGPELQAGGAALYAKVREAMRRVAAMGEERGIVMALENHGNTTADQLLALLKDVNSAYLKFTLDTGNYPPASQVGPETYASIERCAPHAAIVHAKFFDVLADGCDANFDWIRIHAILRKAGFRGFLSVEYEGNDPDEMGAMNKIARFLKTLR